jgi:hypothetical protein
VWPPSTPRDVVNRINPGHDTGGLNPFTKGTREHPGHFPILALFSKESNSAILTPLTIKHLRFVEEFSYSWDEPVHLAGGKRITD